MKRTVIKIGGELAGNQELLKLLASEVGKLRSKSDCLLVHGGGAELSDMMRNVGIEPHFKDGVRQTSPQEMKYVDMVLSGMINKRIVRCFQFEGIDAVGLSGSDGCLFVGDRIGPASHTGEISNVDTTLIDTLMRHHYFPVISSTSMNSAQQIGLNINADSVAFRLAEKMCADCLVFISNIPGILKQGRLLSSLTAEQALREIDEGTVTDGMIPKVRASVLALERGVVKILVGEYTHRGDLEKLISGNCGTQIILGKSLRRKQHE